MHGPGGTARRGKKILVELNGSGRRCVPVAALRTPKVQDKASKVTNPGEAEGLVSNLEHRE